MPGSDPGATRERPGGHTHPIPPLPAHGPIQRTLDSLYVSAVVSADRVTVSRWVRAILVIFLMMGFGFGSWLSRLPALRDEMGASMVQMSIYVLCLAAGSLIGMIVSGGLIERFGPRRMMAFMVAVQIIALPGAIALMTAGLVPVGLAVLFVYGFCFSSTDIAMNVSGANAERVLGRPRMSLLHAFYSIGVVTAMGLGALAESLRTPLTLHYMLVAAIIGVSSFAVLRLVPRDEAALRGRSSGADKARGSRPADTVLATTGPVPVIESQTGSLSTATGSVPIIEASPHASANAAAVMGETYEADKAIDPDDAVFRGGPGTDSGADLGTGSGAHGPRSSRRNYSPWRDPRVLLIGLITLSAGLTEGAPADWLPLALVDGRGVSNELGTIVLGMFYVAVVSARLAGSALLERFGRVTVVRVSLAVAALAILVVTLIDHPAAMAIGAIAWGLGTGVCWPVTISAAADRADTAVRDVATVSAIGYASMLVGPMAFGLLGEYFGLLRSFWVLLLFVGLAFALASVLRERAAKE